MIKLDGVDNETQAAAFANKTFFGLTDELPEGHHGTGMYLSDLIGYMLYDGDKPVGTITDLDDSTENVVITVESPEGREMIVPWVEDFVRYIDQPAKTVGMELPEGLLDINL